MVITAKHLQLMGAPAWVIDIWRARRIRVTWTLDGYRMDGIITAQNLSAAEVIRFIAAAKGSRGNNPGFFICTKADKQVPKK